MSKAKKAVKEAIQLPEGVLAGQANAALQPRGIESSTQGSMISFRHGEVEYNGLIYKASNVGKALRTEIMDLLEKNMQSLYTTSSMGWNRREKQGELFDKVGRFIVIKDKEDNLAAFVNWRFDIEECDEDDPQAREQEDFLEVLYCYEVQIKSDHRSKQLGRLLMDMLLSIAKQSRMRKIMLTVFLSNQGAQSFYSKLGYTSDLISPLVVEKGKSTTDYDIMSLAIAD